MTQSSQLHVLGDNKRPETYGGHDDQGPTNVHGWLMGVHGYAHGDGDARYDTDDMRIPVVGKSTPRRPLSMASISSQDSVNLDDLIKANYTSDMDDETDLPDLANLDLDDSDEEFWKLDEATISQHTKKDMTRARSGSLSSENSMTSQSTVTLKRAHQRRQQPPPSSSNSPLMQRSVSNTQHYPYASSPPLPTFITPSTSSTSVKSSSSNSRTTIMERPLSRASTTLSKRASHIPAPSSSNRLTSFITPQRTVSTTPQQHRLSSLPNKRASHIPTTSTSRARSPTPRLNTGISVRPASSIFGSRPPQSNHGSGGGGTGLRPPSSMGHNSISSTTRSSSRLGRTASLFNSNSNSNSNSSRRL